MGVKNMASDASRRWLDDSGIWSCRIKLPQGQNENQRFLSDNNRRLATFEVMAPTASAILEPGSPSSRRNKGKLEEAMQSLSKELNNGLETSLELPTDPDAQATVTDFLDFTEYLPADMHRSIILIGNQDRIYIENSLALDTALKSYSKFHEIPADKRPDSEAMRAKISDHISQNIAARTHAHAEALRMDQNVGRHVVRAKNILAKLMKMAEDTPPSREASPTPELIRSIPKNPLRQDGVRVDRKHRAPRITVPGEVLAPFDTGYNTWGSDSDSDDLEEIRPSVYKEIPERSTISGDKKVSNVVKKDKKDKATGVQKEKVPRGSRPPGVMGTNVHSAVAGISTSNALAMLAPIPASAVPGDKHLPWLELNEYELGTLRKTMKKNALWVPSDTMKARSLAESGRGYENYMKAVERAAAEGKTIEVPPQLRGVAVTSSGAISLEALRLQDNKTINRGMRLNEAKKAKRLKEKMEAAEVATQEAEAALHKMTFLQSNMANIFVEQTPKAKPVAPKAAPKSAPKKRKRESSVVEENVQVPAVPGMPLLAAKPVLKRAKTETPVPVPQTIFAKQVPLTSSGSVKSTASPAPTITPVTPVVEKTPELLALPVVTTRQSSTPILPPKKELRKIVKKEIPVPEPTPNTRSRRSDEVAVPPTPAVAPEPLTAKRPSSSRDKKTSEEPAIPFVTTTSDRPRRTSTARNTPAPPEPHKMNRRAKRPPPGAVSAQSETSTIVSNRSKATSKKARVKKEKKDEPEDSVNPEVYEEFDDEGRPIDPNEPRYCLCNRVSFGEMISCDNKDCPIEWFHLECVALVTAPRKSTKWYCPDCRVTLKKGGPTGQVTARGKFF